MTNLREIAEKILNVLFEDGCWPSAKEPMISDIEKILREVRVSALEEAAQILTELADKERKKGIDYRVCPSCADECSESIRGLKA